MAKLAQYEERKGDNSVEENIDGRILELLGLEDVVDFTYSEYKTLLRDKMIAGTMPGQSGMSNEDVEDLTNEYKRVKSKTGIFVIKSNKPTDLSDDTGPKLLTGVSNYQKVSSPPDQEEDEKDSFLTSIPLALENITNVLRGVNDSLRLSAAIEEETLELQKEKDLKEQREKEEKESEKKKGILGFVFPKIQEPVVSFVDKIFDFVKNIAIGSALLAVLKWIQDPKNQEAIDDAVEFVVDKAPLILGGLLALLALPIASTMISVTTAILGAMKAFAVAMAGFLANPVVLGALGAIGTLFLIKGARDLIRNRVTGGEDFSEAHDALNRRLAEAGMTRDGRVLIGNEQQRRAGKGPTRKRTPEEEKLFQEVERQRKQLDTGRDTRNQNKDRIQQESQAQIDALKSDPRYSTTKEVGASRNKRTVTVLTEEGEKKKKEIEAEAEKAKSRENLLARMETVKITNPELYEELVEKNGESSANYVLWSMLTHGDDVTQEDLANKDNIAKFEKDTGYTLPSINFEGVTPPQPDTGMEPQDMQEPQLKVSSMPDNVQKSTEIEPPSLKKSSVTPPKPPRAPLVSVVTAPRMSGGSTSGSRARTSTIPTIGAVDKNNDTMVITKSLYNIIA